MHLPAVRLAITAVAALLAGAVLAATNRLGREVIVQTITWAIVAIGCYLAIDLGWGLAGVAYALVLSQIYSTTHMYMLANQCFRAKFRELFAEVGPALLLNGILVAVLFAVDAVLPAGTREHSQAVYLIIRSLTGGLAYALAFLFLPLPSLAPEALRWKKLLRLVPQHA